MMTALVLQEKGTSNTGRKVWRRRLAHVAERIWILSTCACTKLDVDAPWGFREVRHIHRMSALISPPATEDDDYSIVVPLGVPRRSMVLAARDALQVGKNVKLFEPEGPRHSATTISSTGELHVGTGAHIGSVYGMGEQMVLEEGVVLDGFGKSVGPYFGPYRSPAILDRAVGYAEEFQWKVRPLVVPTRVDNIVGPTNSPPLDLAPGAYGTLSIENGSIVRLRGGSYFLDALVIHPRGILQIDNTSDAVYIWVKNTLVVGGSLLDYADLPTILLGYLGTEPPKISMPLHATLVAPNASVTLPATREPHRGAVFARSISVDDDAQIEARAFAGWAFSSEPASLICSRCSIAAAASVGSCCDDFERRLTDIRTSAVLCDPENWATHDSSLSVNCAAGANDADGMRRKFRECVMSAEAKFVACEVHFRYREDTCDNLGFGLHAKPECSE